MNILAFDTSLSQFSLALYLSEKIVFYMLCEEDNKPAEKLVSTIDEALKDDKIEHTDINYVAVTKGPGSFSGIRVAIACAQAMCFATSAKPIVFTTFDICCSRAKKQIGSNIQNIYVILKAHAQAYYVQSFDLQNCIQTNYKIMSFSALILTT